MTSWNWQPQIWVNHLRMASQRGKKQTLMNIRLLDSDIMHQKENNSYYSIKFIKNYKKKPSELRKNGYTIKQSYNALKLNDIKTWQKGICKMSSDSMLHYKKFKKITDAQKYCFNINKLYLFLLPPLVRKTTITMADIPTWSDHLQVKHNWTSTRKWQPFQP